ncbi:MAG TPA: DUF1223 domain-containing protein [Vicinamibacterales bacterium]|jgi:hypothetical protein|nr:DUF1223 domain-containing protein [Vicinamibacterales bacterium]
MRAGMLIAAAAVTVAAVGSEPARLTPPARHVVLAELFTSEGCSSCPPADALLQRLAAASPIEGVEVLALEEHVDYWDTLGWRDPFSSSGFTRRQSDYDARVFRNGDIYTPQVVVDGAFDAIGSDTRSVRDAIARAATRPGADLRVTAAAADGRAHTDVHVDIPASLDHRKDADIVVAIVEDGLTSHVERGENRGRTLPHASVVRSMKTIGAVKSTLPTADAVADVPLDRAWQMPHLRVVAFVQEHSTLRILGSVSQSFSESR